MSRRMTSETIIFDTEWLTEADFGGENHLIVSIDYQAYDTLKIIATPVKSENQAVVLNVGGFFQEFDVYKLENFGLDYKELLNGDNDEFSIDHLRDEGYFELAFRLEKSYWEDFLKGIGSIYIKGVKR